MTPHERTDAEIALAVRDWLEEGVSALPEGTQLPAAVRDQIITQLPTTPQRRRWWTDRWSTRGRGVMRSDGVPGDRENRTSHRMFGFATLLAAGAIGGAVLLAGINEQEQEPAGRTIVVAQDGSGDATTITEGVAISVDGDTVLVRPGVYQESPVVSTAITIKGDGPREAVIVEGTQGVEGATTIEGPYSFVLVDSDATLTDLTIRGMAGQVVIVGGSPVLTGLALTGTGVPFGSTTACTDDRGCGNSLTVDAGSTARIRGNRFEGGADLVVTGNADPVIEDNELIDGPHFYLEDPGDAAILRNNAIRGTFDRAIGVFAPTTMLIEGNRIADAGGDGITIGWELSAGVDPLVRRNTISGSGTAIKVANQAKPRIEGNDLRDNLTGILLINSAATIVGNTIHGTQGLGISVPTGGAPVIEANVLEHNGHALSLNAAPDAVMAGNRFCGNAIDYRLDGVVAPPPAGNPTCDAESSTAP